MLSPGATRVGVNALTLETRLRALDIAVVVDSNAVIQLAGHTHLIGTTFDPSTEISTYINSSAKGQVGRHLPLLGQTVLSMPDQLLS